MKAFWLKNKNIAIRLGGVLLLVLFYRCPTSLFFGFDCPGCGVTRAFLAALRLDFSAAFDYHPLFLLLGVEVFYWLFYEYTSKLIPLSEKAITWILTVTGILMVIVWALRNFIL